jgi:hypothetical protein
VVIVRFTKGFGGVKARISGSRYRDRVRTAGSGGQAPGLRPGDARRGIVAPSSDERELLVRFLHSQRVQVMATTEGLTEQQLRWTPDDRLLPILGVVNHLTHVEWRWIEGRYLGRAFPPRSEEFRLPDELASAEVIDRYRAQSRRTDDIVRSAPDLTAPLLGAEAGHPPAHVLLHLDQPLDLRWAVLHLIEETAHHAGHADSTRELLDGRRMRT